MRFGYIFSVNKILFLISLSFISRNSSLICLYLSYCRDPLRFMFIHYHFLVMLCKNSLCLRKLYLNIIQSCRSLYILVKGQLITASINLCTNLFALTHLNLSFIQCKYNKYYFPLARCRMHSAGLCALLSVHLLSTWP